MKKQFRIFISATAFLVTFLTHNAMAQALYLEGKDYRVLEKELPLQKKGEKEVVEFFSYACPHCAHLEPKIVEWEKTKKPQTVGFYQIPAVGGKIWTFAAQVKFVADKLNLGHEFDQKLFDEIHNKHNRRLLGVKESVIDFMVKEGKAERSAAEKAWNSLQVKNALKNSDKSWNQAGLTGVPAVVVNGKYVVELTDYKKFFSVIDYLLASTSVSTSTKTNSAKQIETTSPESTQPNAEKKTQ